MPPTPGVTARNILVVRGGAIGDFILTVPVLAALRRHFPSAQLELLGHPHIAQLAVAGGLIARLHRLESAALAPFFAPNGGLAPQPAAFFAGFDLIVSYLHDPEFFFQSNVARCASARWVNGPHRPDESLEIHATEQLLAALRPLGILDADPVPRLALPGLSADAWAAGRWLALHPGSGSEGKNWPETQWAKLLRDLIAATDLNLLLVGGEAEAGRVSRLAGSLPPERVRLAVDRTLVELAQWLARCVAFVGHDSGITHLAAAVGLPGVILWGETNETVWRPRSERMVILRDPGGVTALSETRVFKQLENVPVRERQEIQARFQPQRIVSGDGIRLVGNEPTGK
ncbi:MAG: glycosyltransferase family 9 protein [Limisphaerales bacterium]